MISILNTNTYNILYLYQIYNYPNFIDFTFVNYMEDVAIEFISGNLAGWSLVTTGMPLDLIKTKLQLNKDINL